MYIKYSELDDVDRSIVEDSHQIKLYEFMMKKGDTLRNIEDESVESIKKNQYICVSLRLSNLLVKEEFLLIKSAKFKLNRLKAEHKTLGDVKFELHQNITEECWHTNFSNQKINELGLPEITKLYDTKILKEDEMIEFEITDMVKEAYLNNNNLISFILKNDYLGLDNEQFIVSHTLNPKFEFIMDSSELGINTNDEMQMNYSDDIKIYMNLASGNKMIEHHLFKGIKDEINYDFRVYYNDNLLLKSYTYTTNYSYLIYNHVDNLYYEILTPNLISLKYYKLTAKVYNTLSKETKEIAGNYDEYLYYCFKNNCLARITEEEKKFYLSKKVQILFSELGYAHTLKIDEQNCYQIEHNLSGQLTELKLNNNLIIQLNHNTYMCFNTLEEAVFLENGSTLEIIKRKYIDQASGYRVLQNYDLTIEESIIERSALDPDLWSAYVRRFISIKNKITDIQENYSFSEVNYKKITEIKTIYTINNYLKNLLFFHYSKNKTKVTNHKNESAQYFYDSDGIVFQKVDSYNQIVSYEYIKDEKRSKTLYTKTPSYEISSENFIKNGDFSEVSSLTDIHFGWYLDNTSLSMSSLSSQVDGQKNFEANITDSQNFFMEQSIILQEGKYDLKFIYKLIKKDSIDPRVKLIVKKVYFTSGNMPNEAFIENDYLESSASWKEKKVSSINISQYEAGS